METTIVLQITLLILAIFTVLAGLAVVPYTLTGYNVQWLPQWICPDRDYLNRTCQYYYPAQESRVSFAMTLFAAALIAAVHAVYINDSIVRTESILLLYAAQLPAYLLHRILCFHKLNEFTPVQESEDTNRWNVYRIWKAALLWLAVLGILMADVLHFRPLQWVRFLTIAMSVMAIFAYFIGVYRRIKENSEALQDKKFRKIFLELVPDSYYLIFTVLGITLTQAALWLGVPGLLIGWVLLVIAFTVVEYHFRFVSPYRTDGAEQWGEEPYNTLYTPGEELWIIRRRDEATLRHKNAPCWIVITESPVMPGHHRVQLTANIEYKQREIVLRREKLLYIRRFDTVKEARHCAQSIEREQLADEKIRELNPTCDDLNRKPTRVLSFLNTMI